MKKLGISWYMLIELYPMKERVAPYFEALMLMSMKGARFLLWGTRMLVLKRLLKTQPPFFTLD